MSQEGAGVKREWTRAEIERTLKEILVDALGVEEKRVVPEASLVRDLGAESIDFLDISFRTQQIFGVELPNKAIQDKVLSWRNMSALNALLEARYGASVAPEEMRQFNGKGIRDVLQWLGERRGVRVEDGEAEKVAAELAERLAREIEAIGFKASMIDRGVIIREWLGNFNSPKIMEGMLRLFSVGALVDFISARVGEGMGNS